jgi:hypothetical protein
MQKLFWVLGVSLLVSTALFGQTTSLTGTVTDPSGAVIPSATISIANVQTGAQRDVTSDNQGRYTIPQLTPGTYKVTAKAPGFSDVIINNLELLVNQPATVPIVFEKVGTTTTTVTVEAATAQVNTTDASLGNAISTQAIIEMPMYARSVAGLLAFQPGVTSFGSFGAQNLDYRSGSVNGGKSDQSNITLDGADVADQNTRQAFTSVLRVTLDSVEEFRTVTGNGDAATGRGSGADIQLVTKSGTNEIHGSLYEYRRGTETAANSFFNNRSRVARPPLLINIFGGSVGGAIKKNKLFYFLNYEGRRDASAVSVTRTVPTESLKQGIITYHKTDGTLAQAGPTQIKGIDPAGIGISPAALKDLQSLFPVGNNSQFGDGLNTTGFTFNAPGHADQNTYISKFDYHLSDRHSLFIRGNLQNDSADNGSSNAPQFPGLPANSVSLANSKGLAVGWTGVLTPSFVSTFRYGFTRAGNQDTGVETTNYEWFRGFTTPFGVSTGLSRIVPVHNLGQDFSWNHGAHDIRFGAVVRLISNSSLSYGHSFSFASSNPSWLKGSGNDLSPASLGLTKGDTQSFQYAMGALLGLEVQGNANYNYLVDGTLITPGLPVARDFVNHEGELYVQDTWKATRNLTITAGLRFTLAPPVYESNGQQASTNIPLADWLAKRAILADQGLSQAGAGLITFVPMNQGRPMYPFHKDWAPRIGLAYSPKADSGLSKFFFGGPGKTSIRAGAGMYYDILGQPLAQLFNSTAFGLASSLTSPPNVEGTAQVPRYTGFFTVPPAIVPAAPTGGLPKTYPTSGAGSFAITNSIDDRLKAPYTINLDFSIGRELGRGFYVQGSYVGRLSRHSLVNQDLAMPTNLKDPKSGQTYFQAMTQLATLLDIQGVSIANLPKIPFFENLWSKAAGNGLTATQVWANDYKNNSNPGDFSNTLNNADNSANCNTSGTTFVGGAVDSMACGDLGPFAIFNPQFSALSAFSSIGKGNYHAMQWSVRKRFSGGLLFDLNYTWSKSIDLGSTSEAGTCNPTCDPTQASFTGFIQNTWNASQMRGVSSYDTTHAVNAYFVYELPFGRGRKFGAGMNRILDAFVGGWQINGTYRQSSGLPFSVGNGQRWPTNWEVSDIATPNGTPIPSVVSTGNATSFAGPNLWQDPKAAFASFQETMAGQSGSRNTLRGDGFFNVDSGVYKSFTMPWSEHQKLTFRWEAYNVTNSVRFDPTCGGSSYGTGCASLTSSSSFGKLNTQLGTPRQMQFAMRYSF